MIIFWILAAGLVVLALMFVLVPLFGAAHGEDAEPPAQDALNLELFRQRLQELDADRANGFLDQDQYDSARHDLERDLLHDIDGRSDAGRPASALSRWLLAVLLTLAVPAASVWLYLHLGVPDIIERLHAGASAQTPGHDGKDAQATASMEELVTRLEERLRQEPDNMEGWLMLGRTYFATDRPQKGLEAVRKAYDLSPETPDVMLAYAEALAAASATKSLEGKPEELVHAALAKDPANSAARWLLGMIAYQRGQTDEALQVWQKILDELDPKSEEAKNLSDMIAEVKRRAAQPGTPAAPAGEAAPAAAATQAAPRPVDQTTRETTPAPAATSGAAIQVEVALDPALAARAGPEDTVFVFARAAAGPPMPLAVQRLQVKELPRTVTLDDSLAMMPSMRLSTATQVVVGARISHSGEAMPQSGDLEGDSGPLPVAGTDKVSITIDRVRP